MSIGAHAMTLVDELTAYVDSLDEDGQDYLVVRAIKRITHDLARAQENNT